MLLWWGWDISVYKGPVRSAGRLPRVTVADRVMYVPRGRAGKTGPTEATQLGAWLILCLWQGECGAGCLLFEEMRQKASQIRCALCF